MAFPFVYTSTFDSGSNAQWNTEDDGEGMLDFPHYSTLAKLAGIGPAVPYRGAYCMRLLSTDGNAHTLEAEDVNISAGATASVSFALYISPDFAASVTDIFNILEFLATSTVEAAVSLQITQSTNLVEIGIGETAASTFTGGVLVPGVWHTIHCTVTADSGGTDGTIDLVVDGNRDATQIATLSQNAITSILLGTINQLSTTTGTLLFDELTNDDGQIIMHARHSQSRLITAADTFLFVGPGTLNKLDVHDGGSGDVRVDIYDTDVYSANLLPIWTAVSAVNRTYTPDVVRDMKFSKGCLVRLAGTTPGAVAQYTPHIWTDGAIRSYGQKRTNTLATI